MVNKLELSWAGKHDGYALIRDEETGTPVQVPYDEVQPRLLVEADKCGDETADNVLISGENLYALKTLVKSGYAGIIKLIYIDPPYNTGNAFTYYDDALEHSLWLTMIRDRLELLKDLLADDGSIWVQLDDNEVHYCRVLMDQIFGRRNFISNVIWQKIFAPKGSARHFSANHDHILLYAKNIDLWQRNLLPRTEVQDQRYKNPDTDPRGDWASDNLTARNYYSRGTYPVTSPSGRVISGPPKGTYWRVSPENFEELDKDNRIWWGEDGNNMPRLKRFLSEVQTGVVPQTIWFHHEAGNTQEAKKEILSLFPNEEKVFDTAKPERLMKRIIEIGSNQGDFVLDCFLGTGTTAAVAHKMNRRWVGIEAAEHGETLCRTRLTKVVKGADSGGISAEVKWQGGGGFRYYTLGKSLMERDAETGIWRLNYTNELLVEAVCLQEGFKLLGRGNYHGVRGHHYAHIADTIITQEYVEALAAKLTEDESLTIYYMKAKRKLDPPDGVQLKRIPRDLMQSGPVNSVSRAEVATA